MSKSFRISIKNRYNSLHSFFFLGSGLLRPSLVCISGFCPVLAHSHQSSGFCPVLAHSHQRIRDWLKTDWTVQELLFVCFGQCQIFDQGSLLSFQSRSVCVIDTRKVINLSLVVGSYIARAYDFLFRIVYRTTAQRCYWTLIRINNKTKGPSNCYPMHYNSKKALKSGD